MKDSCLVRIWLDGLNAPSGTATADGLTGTVGEQAAMVSAGYLSVQEGLPLVCGAMVPGPGW